MEESIWSVLGIEATKDERAIKRAYAARVKVTSPEADAAGYMKLRAAYEEAKNRARMQSRYDELEAEEAENSTEESPAPVALVDNLPPPASEPATPAAPAATPQQMAIGELHTLLTQRERETFLKRLIEIKAAGIFETLDDEYHFIGTVAVMIDEVSIEDSEWRGRVAQALGAREHENIFTDNARYWHAYEALLRDYADMRAARTQAHLDDIQDDSVSPGYVHVYQVLTAPFDAERMSALTRSSTYHRLAERLLKRAKTDPSIVIPVENREWWERTAMAGFHKPVFDQEIPTLQQTETVESPSGRFPFWAVGMILFMILNGIRMCSGTTTQYSPNTSTNSMEKFRRELPIIVDERLRSMKGYDKVARRLEQCDAETRSSILLQLYLSFNYGDGSKVEDNELTLASADRDPRLKALLAKCPDPDYMDLDGPLELQQESP